MDFNIIIKYALKDNIVFQRRFSDEDIKNLVRNPAISKCKGLFKIDANRIPLIRFGYAEGNFIEGRAKLKDIKVKSVSHLILDYDNKEKFPSLIDTFVSEFNHLEFYLYSTKSSTKVHNRFRVIIPLKEMVSQKDIWHNRHKLIDMFALYYANHRTNIDESCLKSTQYQLVPFKVNKYYRFVINKGKRLSLAKHKADCILYNEGDDSQLKDNIIEGKRLFQEIEPDLKRRYFITKQNSEKFKKYVKDTNIKCQISQNNLSDIIKLSLKNKNKELNSYTVASMLAAYNVYKHYIYPLASIEEAYFNVLGKKMSDEALRKYYYYLEKNRSKNKD